MKRGFGWFFVISSILIIIRGILMISAGMDGSGILTIGILSVMLGTWMIDTSKPKEKRSLGNSRENVVTENNDDLKIKETNQQDTGAISKPINVPESSIEEDSIDTSDIDKETIALATMFSYKIEMEFEDTIEDALKSTTKSDPVIQGMAIYSSIALTSKHLKETDFSEFSKQSGIAKNELDAIIDRIASKVHDKYLASNKENNTSNLSYIKEDNKKINQNNIKSVIKNFHDLEERILFVLRHISLLENKTNSEELGLGFLSVFKNILEEKNMVFTSSEFKTALNCIELMNNFELESSIKEDLNSIKFTIKELITTAQSRENLMNKANEYFNEGKNQNLYNQISSHATPLITNGYRKIAKIRNCAPTNKTSDEEIISIYKKVGKEFKEASRAKGEHIPTKYLNTIVLKFLHVFEIGGSTMLDEHLEYEIDKYIKEGLREDYKVDLQIF